MTGHSVIVGVTLSLALRVCCAGASIYFKYFLCLSYRVVHWAQHDLFIKRIFVLLLSSSSLALFLIFFIIIVAVAVVVTTRPRAYVKSIESNQKFHFDVWSLPFIDSFRLIWSSEICIILSFILINVICVQSSWLKCTVVVIFVDSRNANEIFLLPFYFYSFEWTGAKQQQQKNHHHFSKWNAWTRKSFIVEAFWYLVDIKKNSYCFDVKRICTTVKNWFQYI